MNLSRGVVGIKDVAKEAGVSVGTVSNVLNRSESVSKERRKRVRRAITRLGYVPNVAARQLKAGISQTVGLIVSDAQNPFYGAVAASAGEAAELLGLGLFVANSQQNPKREEFYLSQFEQQRARGVLVAPCSSELEQHRHVSKRGMRVVLVDSVESDPDFCTVISDDFHGGRLAVQHLLETGRSRIAVVGGPAGLRQIERRYAGALAAAEGSGAEISYIEPDEMSIIEGRAVGDQILDAPGAAPDAIFAMNDLLATGLLQALVMRRGVSVPDDIALVGYDDIDFCASAVVPLTSIRQPSEQMGGEALRLLESEVGEGRDHKHRSVVYKPELVVRGSTVARKV